MQVGISASETLYSNDETEAHGEEEEETTIVMWIEAWYVVKNGIL